jgi:hypothetical protein
MMEADSTMQEVMSLMSSYLPLELFEFEDPYLPHEWVALGKNDPALEYTMAETPYYYLQQDAFEMEKCQVIGYETSTRYLSRIKLMKIK